MFVLSDLVRKRAEITVRSTTTGALLIDLMSGRCWQLNRLGAEFLSEIETEKSLHDVFNLMENRYNVSREVLERDLLRLAQELLDAGLIERPGK
ncbi:MAG TPA: PqqD family protein [Polyangia bacterium]|nr:PqqD family protein [Polyangia bacterium]